MSWKFNPPPGWPQQPEGWVPPPGWTPDPSWPAPPAGWQFWVPADSPPAASSPAAAPSPGAATSSPFAGAGGAPSSGAPAPAGPPPAGGSFGGAPPPGGGAPPPGGGAPPPGGGYYPPAGGVPASKPWFSRWWAILGLVGLLVVGAGAGYFGTRLALEQTSETEQTASDNPSPPPVNETGPPEPTESPDVALPTVPPIETAPPGDITGACGEVAIIMVRLITATGEAEDLDDLVDARRTAADDVRALEDQAADDQEGEAVVTLADELDGAADMIEDSPDEATFNDSADRIGDAYNDFNDEAC